jgi:predicted Zn-dependent protease
VKQIYLSAALVLLLALLISCSTSPTGRTQFIAIPDAQMNALGDEAFTQLKSDANNAGKLDSNKTHLAYVHCISDRLLVVMGEKPESWEVEIFIDDTLNAFALPGKKIGIHSGMIKFATADELAAVVGHEIGHVLARHGAERMTMGLATQLGTAAAAVALKDQQYQGEIVAALGIGAQFGLMLPYSRTHESEADAMGLAFMAKAGFNPKAAVSLWQKMQAQNKASVPEFMSTHPSNSTRIKLLSQQQPAVVGLYQSASKAQCVKPKAFL